MDVFLDLSFSLSILSLSSRNDWQVTFDNTLFVFCSVLAFPQSIFTCLKSTIKTLEQCEGSTQS